MARAQGAVEAGVAQSHRRRAQKRGGLVEHQAEFGKPYRFAKLSEQIVGEGDGVDVGAIGGRRGIHGAEGEKSSITGADGQAPGARRAGQDGPSPPGQACGEVVRIIAQRGRDTLPGEPDDRLEVVHPAIVR